MEKIKEFNCFHIGTSVNELIEDFNDKKLYFDLLKLQTTFYGAMLDRLDKHINKGAYYK